MTRPNGGQRGPEGPPETGRREGEARPRPIVAIVGRPNVGKSTLFNKLVGRRQAIVEETAGVTRDRLYGEVDWAGHRFRVVDTGGLELDAMKTGGTSKNRVIAKGMIDQAFAAVGEADAVIALFDAVDGFTATDREILARLRGVKKPVFFAANKIDHAARDEKQWEFYEAGVEKVWPISAEHGRGVNDLLDAVVETLPASAKVVAGEEEAPEPAPPIRVAIVGHPNVGKSSLLNRLVGFERTIVSDVPGTTRDSIDTRLEAGGREFVLVDTAGIRRKARVTEKLEKYTVVKALDAIERADVALLVVDPIEGVHEQDAKIAGEIEERGRAAVIVANKWDLAREKSLTEGDTSAKIRWTMKFMAWAPVRFVSAMTGEGVASLLDTAASAYDEWKRRVPTPKLNQWLEETIEAHPPPAAGLGPVKMSFATMGGTRPPTVVIFTNRPEYVHFSYLRYLENTLRERFGFEGTPVRIVLKKKKGKPKR